MKIADIVDKLPTHPDKEYGKRKISDIEYIAVHHSISPASHPRNFAEHHVNNNGWPGIGYHYVIDFGGKIYKTNYANTISYHVSNHNSKSLGVCLIGNFKNAEPNEEQFDSAVELVKQLMDSYNIDAENVKGHSEFEDNENKECPCIDMKAFRSVIA